MQVHYPHVLEGLQKIVLRMLRDILYNVPANPLLSQLLLSVNAEIIVKSLSAWFERQ